MPKANDAPQHLRPYLFHKVELPYQEGSTADACGTCPFCGREQKFFVSVKTGLYDCKTCNGRPSGSDGKGGNAYTFIRELYWLSQQQLSDVSQDELAEVAENRTVSIESLTEWGLVKSAIDGEWMLPGYGDKGEVNNLYRWSLVKDKRRLLSTAGMHHCLFGVQFYVRDKSKIMLSEGPWNSIKLQEVLAEFNPEELAATNLLGVPGRDTFRDEWLQRFAGKDITILFDNDYPKTRNGKVSPPGAFESTKTLAKKLRAVAKSLNYLDWGAEGWTNEYADGCDVRDLLGVN